MMIARLIMLALIAAGTAAQAVESAAPANLFPAQTWQPPLPPPPPPPKPSAPPLPFIYQGQLREGDATVVFLANQQRQIVVKTGDIIDNTYRVDAVTPQRVEFTYLPLHQKQQISTGTNP